jgi:hypothetical protein
MGNAAGFQTKYFGVPGAGKRLGVGASSAEFKRELHFSHFTLFLTLPRGQKAIADRVKLWGTAQKWV